MPAPPTSCAGVAHIRPKMINAADFAYMRSQGGYYTTPKVGLFSRIPDAIYPPVALFDSVDNYS